MKKKSLLIIILFVIVSITSYGQAGPPGAPCWPPPCVPVDGGITIFALIAAFFGYRSFSKNK